MNQVAQSINLPLQLLGGISPAEFMRKYWQKKPCIIRNAIPTSNPCCHGKNCLRCRRIKTWSRDSLCPMATSGL